MNKKTITKVFVILLTAVCWAGGCTESLAGLPRKKVKPNPVDTILKQLNQKTKELKSYYAQIEYLFSQPLFESQTLRKGILYYQKAGRKSTLRIDFQTLKQDDEQEQKYIEQYILDGRWLTQIDYQIKEVRRYELAEPNEPVDVFELVSRHFPLIGFSKAEDLKKQFETELICQEQGKPSQFIQLHLKVRPDSTYKDDYTSIDFWIDKKLYLPAKIVAVSTEGDIRQIKFVCPKVNKKLKKKVFEIEIPKGFTVGKTPLEKAKKGNKKGN